MPTPASITKLVLTIFFFHLAYSSQKPCNQQDHDSLSLFAKSIHPQLNWPSNASCCNWEGLACDGDGRVNQLWLPNRNLTGKITPSLVNLTRLSHVNLSGNQLSGSIPVGFFRSLVSLQIIDLSFNLLSGNLSSPNDTFPAGLQEVDISSNQLHWKIILNLFQSNLRIVNASNNLLYGQIPESMCARSPLLTRIDLTNNNLWGEIPTSIGGCSGMKVFRAGFNSLSGTLPDSIYTLRSLREISLPVNNLGGTLDERISGLTNLTSIELFSNAFHGNIPRNMGDLIHLEQLYLHINNFSGSIPPPLMNCTALTKLILRVNDLEGDVSSLDFSRMANLQVLDLGNNHFTGNFPESIYLCKSITDIRVAANRLSGQISPNILALRSLSFLSLSDNTFTNITKALTILSRCKELMTLTLSNNFYSEVIPADVNFIASGGFPKLQVIALGGCKLAGHFPSWVGNLRPLQIIDLSNNSLTGTLPERLGNMPSLFYMDFSNNLLSGDFPLQLTKVQTLLSGRVAARENHRDLELPIFAAPDSVTWPWQTYDQMLNMPSAIYLGNNSITGPVPVEIGQLVWLDVLDLSGNQFSGSIPSQLSDLSGLEELNLSNNCLSGEIPTSLNKFMFLSRFNVSYNDLQGPIPTGGQFDTFPESSYLGNPKLCGRIVLIPCSAQAPQSVEPTHGGNWYDHPILDGFGAGLGAGFAFVVITAASCFYYKWLMHSL